MLMVQFRGFSTKCVHCTVIDGAGDRACGLATEFHSTVTIYVLYSKPLKPLDQHNYYNIILLYTHMHKAKHCRNRVLIITLVLYALASIVVSCGIFVV